MKSVILRILAAGLFISLMTGCQVVYGNLRAGADGKSVTLTAADCGFGCINIRELACTIEGDGSTLNCKNVRESYAD